MTNYGTSLSLSLCVCVCVCVCACVCVLVLVLVFFFDYDLLTFDSASSNNKIRELIYLKKQTNKQARRQGEKKSVLPECLVVVSVVSSSAVLSSS